MSRRQQVEHRMCVRIDLRGSISTMVAPRVLVRKSDNRLEL